MSKNTKQIPLYEKVLHDLKAKILSGVYKKGDILPTEKELIDEYGVSRITIRKTLTILAQMGFIETIQGRGSTVLFELDNLQEGSDFAKAAQQHYKDFQASTQVRLMLEPSIAKAAAKVCTKEQVQYLKTGLGSNKDSNIDFHKAVASILDNPIINDVLQQLISIEESGATLGLIAPENQEEVVKIVEEQHHKIYEAIKNHDEDSAFFYMREHTMYMSKLYEEYYDRLRNN